jgi:hypothetical protein
MGSTDGLMLFAITLTRTYTQTPRNIPKRVEACLFASIARAMQKITVKKIIQITFITLLF